MTQTARDKPYTVKLSVKGGPNKFSVVYDGVLSASSDAEASEFLRAFRRLLSNGHALPDPEPGPGEVTIRKDGTSVKG